MHDERAPASAAPRSGAHSAVFAEWGRAQRAAAVVGPALTVAALAVVILVAGLRYNESRRRVSHTRDVLATAQTTLTHVQDAETGQRGYLLTGDRAYLAPYDSAHTAIPGDLALLDGLVRDNASQQRRVGALRSYVGAKLAELDSTIRLHDRGDAAGALAVVRGNRGRVLMDSIRLALRGIETTESALLAARQRREDADARLGLMILAAGSALAVLLALLTNQLLATAARRHARQAMELATANEMLQDQAAELEIQSQQLQEQQVELEATNEHLQEQATALESQQAELEMQAEELMAANEELVGANAVLSETAGRLTLEEARGRRLVETAHAAREAAERAQLEAEHANQAKSQFLSTMSHELRTPLNGIAGHTQLIELGIHGPVTDAQRQALARIARAQQHLLSLIDDILNLSRIEAGKLEYDVRETPLAEVVADVAPMVEPQLAAKGVTLAIDLPAAGDRPLLVWADRDRLRQVVLNLLSNATKFTPGNGRVQVRIDEPADRADQVALVVSDTGYGIPSDKLGAIFEPFVQAHRRSPHVELSSQQGTGLGLTISRDLMRGMGGDIEVESVVGEGSTFRVLLRRVVAVTGDPTDRRTGDERRLEEERRQVEDRRADDGQPNAEAVA